MELVRRATTIKGIKLLDSEKVSEEEWEKHVQELHEFFGPIRWTGDDCGVQIEDVGDAEPGEYVVVETWPNGDEEVAIIEEEEFLSVYEVA